MVENSAKVLGAFLGTLYLNVYQTDTNFQVVKKKLPDELKLEWQQLNARVGAELASACRAAALPGCLRFLQEMSVPNKTHHGWQALGLALRSQRTLSSWMKRERSGTGSPLLRRAPSQGQPG